MTERFQRRLSPGEVRSYREYRSYLRYEFKFRCCYCGAREDELLEEKHFEIDHYRPKSIFPDLEKDYKNLYYSCLTCNRYKRNIWPTSEEESAGLRIIDPCTESLIGDHATLTDAGFLIAKTATGQFTIEHLGLNRFSLVKLRRLRRVAQEEHYGLMDQLRRNIEMLDALLRIDIPGNLIEHGFIREQRDALARTRAQHFSHFMFRARPLDEGETQ